MAAYLLLLAAMAQLSYSKKMPQANGTKLEKRQQLPLLKVDRCIFERVLSLYDESYMSSSRDHCFSLSCIVADGLMQRTNSCQWSENTITATQELVYRHLMAMFLVTSQLWQIGGAVSERHRALVEKQGRVISELHNALWVDYWQPGTPLKQSFSCQAP